MAIRIGSNSASLGVTRRIDEITRGVSQTLERLGSGARINRASDDAAGLSIATALNARSRILNRARANVADASSLVQIADGALGQVSSMLTRMVELAEQAANGSYSSVQRRALDTEYQQLDREIRRIVSSTSFNGLNLLSGGRSERSREVLLTGAAGLEARALSSNGRYAVYTDTTTTMSPILYRKNLDTGEVSTLQLSTQLSGTVNFQVLDNGDVFYNTLSSSDSATGDNIFRWRVGSSTPERLTNSQDIFDFTRFRVSADGSTMYFSASNTDYAEGGTASSAYETNTTRSMYRVDLATGTFSLGPSEFVTLPNTVFVSADGQFLAENIGGGVIRVGRMTSSGVEYRDITDGNGNLAGVDNDGNAIFLSTSNLTGNNPNAYRQFYKFNALTGVTTQISNFQLNAPISNVAISNDGTTIYFRTAADHAGVGTGNRQQIFRLDTTLGLVEQMTNYRSQMFSGYVGLMSSSGNRFLMHNLTNSSIETLDTTNSDASFDIEAGFGNVGNLLVQFESIEGALRGLRSHTLRSSSGAYLALEDMRDNLQILSQVRGMLGAAESRLLSAHSLIEDQGVQFRSAESRLKDVDVAAESARLTALTISQQVASSVLAQVNQAPAIALRLLGSR